VLINFNSFSFASDQKNQLLLNNFFTDLKNSYNTIIDYKILQIAEYFYIAILPNIDSNEILFIASQLNRFIFLKYFVDLDSFINFKILSIKYKEEREDPLLLIQKLFLTYRYDISNYYIECNNDTDYIGKAKAELSQLSLLKKAIADNKILFAYQPIISCKNGNVEYFECLIRIPMQNGKYISVGPLMQLAENNGLINIIDQHVLKMAVIELQQSDIKLSVNISSIGIGDIELTQLIQKLLLNKREVAERLIIEITETSLNVNYQKVKLFINMLHDLGCKIALDDFGVGYSSFSQLINLPIDIIKIDGSYIKSLEQYKDNIVFIESLVKIANVIGAKTVAEFVENKEIAELLTKLHIDGLQGNYFSPAFYNRKSQK
jgi:EAL domain-containing protein (putative c-di-GMP-specific phosphodiesterase class I)